jgi:PAS domain S-box-containing protein
MPAGHLEQAMGEQGARAADLSDGPAFDAAAELRAVLDDLPAMFSYWGADMRNRIANRLYTRVWGLTPDQMRGRRARDVFGEEIFELNLPYWERALAGEPQRFEREIVDASGARRFTEATFTPHLVDGRAAGIVILVTDVTARREAAEELRRSRERLVEAEKIARIGSWEWDIVNDRTNWSDGLFEIYGLVPDESGPTRAAGEERIIPEDRAAVRRTVDRCVEERASVTFEYRIARPDGRVRTLHARGEVIVDPAGEPVRLIGIIQDITDTKLAQEMLTTVSRDLERRAVELRRQTLSQELQPEPPARSALTARQQEILGLVAQGLSNGAIAERLFVTEGTVKWHVKQILARTGASNRAEAVARVLATEH